MATATYKDVFDIELEPGQSLLARLDQSGDARVTWRRGNMQETDIARAAFVSARASGMMAYRTKPDGSQGEVLAEFDPNAEKIILAPPLAGGCGV